MATLNPTNMSASGSHAITKLTLGASDSFTYNKTKNQKLIINNITVGALTPNIVGSAPSSSYPVPGAGNKDLSGGYDFAAAIAADASAGIELNTVEHFLAGSGTVTITNADGAEAMLLEF